MPIVYERVLDLLKKNNMTIYRLEKEMGFGFGTVRAWKRAIPKVDKLKKVADYFGVSVDFLIRGA